MKFKSKPAAGQCPVTSPSASDVARNAADDVVQFCRTSQAPFDQFEQELATRLAVLGCCLTQLFLTARHERLDVAPFLKDGRYRSGDDYAERTLKTRHGEVRYGRRYLQSCGGGWGIFPLDIVLGLTCDALTPWVMQWVARLATRMSFAASRMVCRAVLNWAPATETIEQVVLGLGREAASFMQQLAAPPDDGEVLVIEVDGKCPPTATAAELQKRRGRRRPRPCRCGCQRHRGRAKRQARGSKKRRQRGDKSKNGREVVVVVMYTLKQGADSKLHGPIHKRIWGTFAGRKAAALWARAQATKRGFAPDTSKIIQIVLDGANGLKDNLAVQFPKAIFTLDVCHMVEKLWSLAHHFHKQDSDELKAWVEELKELLYAGQAKELLERLRSLLRTVPHNGPGTKGRRQALESIIGYMESRLDMMRYGEWRQRDLVIASGQVEGTVRHLVGERFDCAGMRWLQGKAEALLHLRCIELNGDWEHYFAWAQIRVRSRLGQGERVKVMTDQPLKLNAAA
jgi:hypothetical protein